MVLANTKPSGQWKETKSMFLRNVLSFGLKNRDSEVMVKVHKAQFVFGRQPPLGRYNHLLGA